MGCQWSQSAAPRSCPALPLRTHVHVDEKVSLLICRCTRHSRSDSTPLWTMCSPSGQASTASTPLRLTTARSPPVTALRPTSAPCSRSPPDTPRVASSSQPSACIPVGPEHPSWHAGCPGARFQTWTVPSGLAADPSWPNLPKAMSAVQVQAEPGAPRDHRVLLCL